MAKECLEKWSGQVNTLKLGATDKEGGSRSSSVSVGGENTLPFLFAEGQMPHRPVIACEIWDIAPTEWPDELAKQYKDVWADPVSWAEKCVKASKAQVICVKLAGAHPELGDKSPDDEAKLIRKLLDKIKVPLIITGCGDDGKDNAVLPACSQAAKNERCLIGNAVQDNYKTLVAACLADGHNIIAESPIDINIAKQLNILITDMGLPLERIAIDPTIGALGYGLEYAYSIMERARLAALSGDKVLASPFLCFVAQETWKVKEAHASESEFPQWGNGSARGIMWEALTATALLQAGGNILVMRHPKAVEKINEYIDRMFQAR
ncbi:MAG: acetyl-CoA decarbonylase/synthase complex subunit delta [Candidatus Omnitrophica bacterium]|nr:acetyl-CoA decarbonylase/synthase complex subunit delta [Candidatus Omnitrophota bacterium]MDD5654971.1 acetyl-CoA decarbonylase/synthase complex subunit delta [Candidatus Omnitrophota bacterium]